MAAVAGKLHKKERKAQHRADRQAALHLAVPLPPLEKPDLTFFGFW